MRKVLGLVAAACVVLAAPPALATFPGANGTVAYFEFDSAEELAGIVTRDPATGEFRMAR